MANDETSSVPEAKPQSDEQSRLDNAIRKADELLVASLHKQDASRRRNSFLLIGGIAMIAVTILFGIILSNDSGPKNLPFTQQNGPVASQSELATGQAQVIQNDAPNTNFWSTTTLAGTTQTAGVDPEKAETLAAEGWALWQKQQYLDAAKKFELATEADPSRANSWNGLGWSRFNGGMPIQAEKAFRRCIELQPNHPAALNGLGWIHFNRGELDRAEPFFTEAVKNGASASWMGLAKIYLLQGKWEDARKWTAKLVEEGSMPQDAKTLHDAAVNETLTDELRRQIAPAAMADQSASRESLKLRARLRMQKDSEKYSQQELAEAETLYQVANKNWRSDEAKQSLKQMVEKYPDINRTGCAVLYLGQMSQGEEREKLLLQAVRDHSDCFYLNGTQVGGFARLLLGHFYLESKHPERAKALFDEIRKDYADAIDHKGRMIVEQIPPS